MLRLTGGLFRYKHREDSYLEAAMRYARVPVKQAVISPSALSLQYPHESTRGYSREEFIHDLLAEHETEIRKCLRKGAHCLQIDFTEGRLAVKIDPTGALLHSFIDLDKLALARCTAEGRRRLGVHTYPGASADVDYSDLLPSHFYVALARERDGIHVLKILGDHLKPEQRILVGVLHR